MNTHWNISKYSFPKSKAWFTNSELKHFINMFLDNQQQLNILEIGSYEGCSSCYFSDILLNNSKSKLICVDPFDINDNVTPVSEQTKTIFYSNINQSNNKEKITVYENFSDDFYNIYNGELFDLIYIDGAHTHEQIKKDLDNCFKLLTECGIMWMDDYNNTWKQTFDNWIEQNKNNIQVIHRGYQLAIKKL
jgi:predicted O-methyltransferase YrrM